jgi:hypothetical protein
MKDKGQKRSEPNGREKALLRYEHIQDMRRETAAYCPDALKMYDKVAMAMTILTEFFLWLVVGRARMMLREKPPKTETA